MDILNKQQGTLLYGEGFFGNRLRQWNDPASLTAASPPPFRVVLRQRATHGGGVCIYGLTISQAIDAYISYPAGSNLYFSEQLYNQPKNIRFQGEYGVIDGIEYLRCSDYKGFHREAIERAAHYSGASCRPILKSNMELRSYEHLITMSVCFDNHVIEFSTAVEPIGCLGWDTIIWEVRKY